MKLKSAFASPFVLTMLLMAALLGSIVGYANAQSVNCWTEPIIFIVPASDAIHCLDQKFNSIPVRPPMFTSDLLDVGYVNLQSGQLFSYNGTHWTNINATATGAQNLTQLHDVVIFSPVSGQALMFNGTHWINGNVATGDVSSASNLNPNYGVFAQKVGSDLQFKSLIPMGGIQMGTNATNIVISTTAENNTGQNIGGGTGIFAQKVGQTLQFRSLLSGTAINIVNNGDNITISNALPESTVGVNDGTGIGLANGGNLHLKSLTTGSGISLVNNTNDIEIDNTARESTACTDSGHGAGNVCNGGNVNLKGIAGTNSLGVTQNATDIIITNLAPEGTNCNDVGSSPDATLCDGGNVNIKSLKAGSNVQLTNGVDQVTISASSTANELCTYSVYQGSPIVNGNYTYYGKDCNTQQVLYTSMNASSVLNSLSTLCNSNNGCVIHVVGYSNSVFSRAYNITKAVQLPESGHFVLQGDGPEFTVFKIPSSYDNNMFEYAGNHTGHIAYFNKFSDFQMVGNKGSGGVNNRGFYINTTSGELIDSLWFNLFLRDFKQDDIYLHSQTGINNCWNNKFDDTTVELAGNAGLYATGGINCQDLKVTNSKFLFNNVYGVFTDGYYGTFMQGWYYKQNQYGIKNNGGIGNIFTNNRFFDDCQTATNTYYDLWNLGNNNEISNNNFEGADSTNKCKYAIDMDTFEHNNVISGNVFKNTYSSGGLFFASTSQTDNVAIGNNFNSQTNPITGTTTSDIIRDNLPGTANTSPAAGVGISITQTSYVDTVKTNFANGTGISITGSTQQTFTNTSPESTACTNDGHGTGNVCNGSNVHLKGIAAGSGITMSQNGTDITINGTGEVNTGSNLGTGANIFASKSGVTLQFRSVTNGVGITVTQNTNDVNVKTNFANGTGIIITGSTIQTFKTNFVNGTGISITGSGAQTITNTAPESTACTNDGHGAGNICNGSNVHLKGIAAGSAITVTQNGTDISIANGGVTSLTSGNSALVLSGSTGAITATPGWKLLANNTYSEPTILNQAAGAGSTNFSCSTTAITICAEHITASGALVGQKVNGMTFPLAKVNSPTGTATFGVFDSSGTVKYTFGTFNIASITGTACSAGNAQVATFYNYGTGYVIQSGDYIGAKSPLQTSTNAWFTCSAGSDAYDGTNSKASQFSGGAFADVTNDLGASLANSNWNLYYTYETISLPATKNLFIQFAPQINSFGSGQISFRFNNDTATNYAQRQSANGGADTTNISQTSCTVGTGALFAINDRPLITFTVKNTASGDRKVIQGLVSSGLDSSAATAPARIEFECKWDNTSAQITSIQFFVSNSVISALGSSTQLWIWGNN